MTKDKKELTFEEWAYMWDEIFTLCEIRKDFRALLVHTMRYKSRWSRGLD